MVNAHVREVGEMSDSDDEEKETPRYRLAEVLHRPDMMEKLFDLSSDENDDHDVNIAVREQAFFPQVIRSTQEDPQPKCQNCQQQFSEISKIG
jgi:hypothetical protein